MTQEKGHKLKEDIFPISKWSSLVKLNHQMSFDRMTYKMNIQMPLISRIFEFIIKKKRIATLNIDAYQNNQRL